MPSRYLAVVRVVNIILGTAVGLSLYLLGLPSAAMWGGVAALLNFIPYFGPIVGMLGVAMAGLLAFDTLGREDCCRQAFTCCFTCSKPTSSRRSCSGAATP
jgi:hypothetical protein